MIQLGKMPVILLAAVALVVSTVASAGAQSAKVTAVVLYVQYQSGPQEAWKRAKVGTTLPAGSKIRTQKRSKCEVKFPDGSYVRLGPRSQMVIQKVTSRRMQLKHGSLFGHIISGHGARIEAGKAVAAVKGTDWLVNTGFTQPPSARVWNTPYGVDWSVDGGPPTTVPGGFGIGGPPPGGSTPGPVPPLPFGTGDQNPFWTGFGSGMWEGSTPGGNAGLGFRWNYLMLNNLLHQNSPGSHHNPENIGDLAVGVSDASSRPGTDALAMLDTMKMTGAAPSLSITAQAADVPVDEVFGKRFFGPYIDTDLFGLWGEEQSVGGVRVHPHVIVGDWYIEAGAMGWTQFDGDWDTFLSEAFALNRSGSGELVAGRQHYLEGPVNNSGLGTLMGFNTFDGVRWKSAPSADCGLDVAWVDDFYPHSGPWDAHGWIGRVTHSVDGIQLGANAVNDSVDGTGYSIDISTAAIPRKLDVYGEFGSRADGQHIETWGIYFPQLYQKSDTDLFVEYAERGDQPGLLSLAAYNEFDDNFVGVLSVNKEMTNNVDLSVGGLWSF